MLNDDNKDYFQFTGPMRLHKQLNSLEGLLEGISIDGHVNEAEITSLRNWLKEDPEHHRFHPFNEIVPRLRDALTDGVIDDDERADLLWLIRRMTTEDNYWNADTTDLQRLHGVVGGIAADGIITEQELRGLSDWMADHEHLRTLWPYDEIGALITAVMADGKIDEKEQRILLSFFNEFLVFRGGRAINFPDEWEKMTVTGVCSVCQEMEFTDRAFCFTGKSTRAPRKDLEQMIAQLGGRFLPRLTKDTTYLIIGADGNTCWAYACYGRKVEQAVGMRRNGHPIQIVHEFDFWDCVEDSCG